MAYTIYNSKRMNMLFSNSNQIVLNLLYILNLLKYSLYIKYNIQFNCFSYTIWY